MIRQQTPESYIKLHVPVPADERSQWIALGPETWANLLIEVALESDRQPDLLDKLAIGNVAINVLFAPDDWRAAAEHPLNFIVSGNIKAAGDVLSVSKGVPRKEKADYDTATFRRDSADAPYRPVEFQDKASESVRFPENTTESLLPPSIDEGLHALRLASELVTERLQSPESGYRWIPYVHISEP